MANPLRGKAITTTGFDLETTEELKRDVDALGGTFVNDLVAGTTHVIAHGGATPKQRSAWERGVAVVEKGWLKECVKLGKCVSVDGFLVPTLKGLEICCSGIEQAQKKKIEQVCISLGGKYTRMLGLSCTHLICESGGGKKWEFARKQDIVIVSPKWVFECERLKRVVDESGFLIDGKGGGTQTGSTAANGSVANHVLMEEDVARGSLEVHEEEQCCLDGAVFYLTPTPLQYKAQYAALHAKAVKAVSTVGGSMSGDISPRVNYIVVVHIPIIKTRLGDIDVAQRSGATVVSLEWLQSCAEESVTKPRNIPRVEWGIDREEARIESLPPPDVTSSVFQGMRCTLGPLAMFDNSLVDKVREKLLRGRAKVLPHNERGRVISGVATHLICGESLPTGSKKLLERARKSNDHVVCVTPKWIDVCLDEERLLNPEECILFRPVPFETPVGVFEKISVTISGFHEEEVRDKRRDVLARVAILLGMTYSERMRKTRTTHLIVDGKTMGVGSEKRKKAKEWGIKMIGWKWLVACAREGMVVNERDYPVEKEERKEEITPGKAKEEEETPVKGGRTPRRSPRLKRTKEDVDDAKIELFKKFTEQLQNNNEIDEGGEEENVSLIRRRQRSRSVSLDAVDREWSMDASQSQVILHRDLTPPPSPTQGGMKRRRV